MAWVTVKLWKCSDKAEKYRMLLGSSEPGWNKEMGEIELIERWLNKTTVQLEVIWFYCIHKMWTVGSTFCHLNIQ